MSIASNFPAIKPSLNLDFANVQQLDSRVTFSRASSATYYGTETAKAEENLFLQSQEFDNAYWTKTRSTVTANSDTAPDGTVTADSVLQASGQTTSGNVLRSVTVAAGDAVISVFAKPNGKNFMAIREVLTDGANKSTWFNVSTGVIGVTSVAHTATITATTNGYYRCSIKVTANAARTGNVEFFIADTDGSLTVADDGSGLYIWGAQLEQRSAVTAYMPTTTQPITNYIPVLESAAAGVPRFDHNPTTFESLGLLIEEQRTNLLTYSEQFDNAAWTKTRSSITANTIVSPDGTLTGDKLIENTDTNTHLVAQAANLTAGTSYTATVYLKAAERTRARLQNSAVANWATAGEAFFDLSTGTVVSGVGTITPVGNGWYRCSITGIFGGSNAAGGLNIFLVSTGTTFSYTGDGYSGIYLWGAQLEAGAFATSYIPTVAASATRSADVATMTGANFSSWYNQSEGTAYVEAAALATAYNASTLTFSDGTNNNRIVIRGMNTGSQSASIGVANNATQWTSIFVSQTAAATKWALGYRVNGTAFTRNAATPLTDADALIPVVNQLRIGADGDGTLIYNGHIRRIAYYPLRVTNAQLQALTG
jgi:hypothetical protein